jgi:type VI protein secretion system component VasK
MLKTTQFWILTVAGGLALALVLVNMYLFQANRDLQAEANTRAQYIQQSIALETLYRQIVQELADRAVRTRDDQIRDMLAADGLNLTFDTRPAAQEGEK